MNLKELFEMQRKLDEHIIEEKGLEGQDLLPKKILALQVELGELAQNWRGFKFWSEDKEPRTILKCNLYNGLGYETSYSGSLEMNNIQEYVFVCDECGGEGYNEEMNPLLEEYVDCLHFILSIGLDLGMDWRLTDDFKVTIYSKNITKQFNKVFSKISLLGINLNESHIPIFYLTTVEYFIGLGEMLGFTEEQIVQAYKDKNQVNHERQENGY